MKTDHQPFNPIDDGETSKMEMLGITALVSGYVQWQAASDSQPTVEEASYVAFALNCHAKRLEETMLRLIYPQHE